MSHDQQTKKITGRVASIDALRGFDMFWIMGGGTAFMRLHPIYGRPWTEFIQRQLTHVRWDGFRFEDLIFPLFLFIVGAVMPFSLTRRIEMGHSKSRLHLRIFQRALILILLGLIMNGLLKFNFDNFRYAGVLQRIGLCYFFGALIVLHAGIRAQAIIFGAILLLYWAALMLIPVPGFGAGVITMQGCLTSYIDQLLLPGKLWYEFGDNEGILSTLPAVATVLMGALAGHWLRSDHSPHRKVRGLLTAGVASLLLGHLWGMVFPVVKLIWTSSYVLVAGGWSLLLLGVFYWLIDVKGYKKWAFFFIVIGMNPILIFFVPRFIDFPEIANYFVGGVLQYVEPYKFVFLALGALMVKWLFLWFLYRRRIFFKV
ncbi:acyltransferase family protein [Planctomycetota bacterium]